MRSLVGLLLAAALLVQALPARASDGCTASDSPGCGGCACQPCVCGMDSYCCSYAWDDLCVDECTNDCGGCGGTNPTNPTCPGATTPIGACGSVTYEGCCNSSGQVMFCDAGQLYCIDCTQNPSCGWQAEAGYYDCATAGGADPTGMNPKSCSGGTTPTVVCGNGLCETGESTVSCPSDCKTGTGYCGDGACNNGETSGTCSGDCPTICTPSCMNKKCGDDGCQGSCGQCPSGTFCNLQFQCEMEGGCEPQCLNKQCGDDTCGSTCGTCPAPLVCNASGQCVTAGTVQPDGGSPSEADAQSYDPSCVPDCDGKVCGSNGCGGTCGKCPQGSGCNAEGLCEPGLVDPGSSPYACGPDETLMYGKCIPMQPTGGGDDGGCGIARPASALSCLVLLGLALALLRRRHRPTRV